MQKQKIKFKRALFAQIGYNPHFGQEDLHYKDWTFNVAVWGRRSGKTLAAAMEALYELAQPDRRVWVVAPSYSLAEKVFREVYKWVVVEGVLGDPNQVITHKRMDPRSGNMIIKTTWGSWIEGKSADAPEKSLVGEGLDLLIIDEAAKIPQGIYEQHLEPTLLDRQGRCLMITTPEGHNWLYRMWLRGQDPDFVATGWVSSRFHSADNPHLNREWIENKKRELNYNATFRQEYEASFEHHTGLVWPEFKGDYLFPNGHLYDDEILREITGSPDLPAHWTFYRSIDIGLDNPTACLWAAVDPQNNIWVYDEYCVRDALADVHAENIIAKTRHPIATSYISHDADNTSKTDGRSVRAVFGDKGLYSYAVRPHRHASIQIVARYIRATLEDSPAHPRILVHKNCPGLRGEMAEYVWDSYKGSPDKERPDKPRKYKDDRVDALRNLLQMEPKFRRNLNRIDASNDAARGNLITKPGRPSAGI